jgi:tetratricopeptide (TPR) repeat protein
MRIAWFTLLVLVVCMPLALVSLLFAEARLPGMDRLTLAEPMEVRSTIAEIAMASAGYGKDAEPKIERVLKLDPANGTARSRVCVLASNTNRPDAIALCKTALLTDPSGPNYNSLGQAQEHGGDPCSAEDSFTSANSHVNGGSAFYLRNMGHAAFQCGRIAYSVAEFGAAEDLDAKAVADQKEDGDDLDDDKADLKLDREWLVLSYSASKQPKLAAEACGKAHPEWKSCSCVLKDGNVRCLEASAGK